MENYDVVLEIVTREYRKAKEESEELNRDLTLAPDEWLRRNSVLDGKREAYTRVMGMLGGSL